MGLGSIGLWTWAAVGSIGVAEPTDPVAIVAGNVAATCQFPSVVSLVADGASSCTGTLIHPEVVLTAAHCLTSGYFVTGVAFGESMFPAGAPAMEIGASCVPHPDYLIDNSHDVGYCLLESPAEVEPTPILAGCETDVLTLGQSVVIVGFGGNFATYNPNTGEIDNFEGHGTKRFVEQTIQAIDDADLGEITMVGEDPPQSACFGDSGGPGFVRLSDGSWRTWGAGSHLANLDQLPKPPDNVCGSGAAYANATLVLPWLESETGIDLTPCWDGDTPVPGGPGCGGFPTEIHHDHGTWAGSCGGGPLAGGAEVCQPFAGPFDPEPENPDPAGGGDDGGDDGDDSESSGGETEAGADDGMAETAAGDDLGGDTTAGEPLDSTGDGGVDGLDDDGAGTAAGDPSAGTDSDGTSGSGGDDGQAGNGEAGCGCQAPASTPQLGWWALAVLGLARRRGGRSPTGRREAGGVSTMPW